MVVVVVVVVAVVAVAESATATTVERILVGDLETQASRSRSSNHTRGRQ